MTLKQLALLMAMGLFTTVAWSGDEVQHSMKIAIVEDDGNGEMRIEIDSDDLGFDLQDMQVGENRAIVDKDGRSILITRGEKNFTFEADGQSIEMPVFGGADGTDVWFGNGDAGPDINVDVVVVRDGMPPGAMEMEGVMIISDEEIDQATQQIIRTALESAGYDKVRFAGGHEGGPQQLHFIERVVEVSD
jgi:hypothetical protein